MRRVLLGASTVAIPNHGDIYFIRIIDSSNCTILVFSKEVILDKDRQLYHPRSPSTCQGDDAEQPSKELRRETRLQYWEAWWKLECFLRNKTKSKEACELFANVGEYQWWARFSNQATGCFYNENLRRSCLLLLSNMFISSLTWEERT